MRRWIIGMAAACGTAGSALAQFDNSPWPGFKGGAACRGSVEADGPATTLAFELNNFATISSGGVTLGSNGDVYFKTYRLAGSHVYRLDKSNGGVLAKSVDLGGAAGNYAGAAVGVDAVFTCIFTAAGDTKIVRLNKDTLAVEATFTNAAFQGLRGTPLIGSVKNQNGNVNLYVHDRNGSSIHCVDSVTGDVMWTYFTIYPSVVGMAGPMWLTNDGRQAVAYFGNGSLGPGAALADNGDGTYDVLWEAVGPQNFNWWGSGALSADGSRIYVTTFNDGTPKTDSLWAVNVSNGSVAWSAGAETVGDEENHFARPAVVGNRVYCGGHLGRIVCYQDNGSDGVKTWTYQNADPGEFTGIAAVKTSGGDVYVYGIQQENAAAQYGTLVVLKDTGSGFEVLLETNLNGNMRRSFLGTNAGTPDADGSFWMGGGRHDDVDEGDIYKWVVDSCYADCEGDGDLDIFDYLCFLDRFANQEAYADCEGDGDWDIFDFLCYQGKYANGCTF